MWAWVKTNKWVVVLIVVACLSALGSALDGCSMRKKAEVYLDLARGWHRAHEKEKEAWSEREKKWQNQREEVRGRITLSRKPPRVAPTSEIELAKRFRELGYEGRVR